MDEKKLIKIAIMYFNEGYTQAQIANQYNVSRSLVSKWLNDIRKDGIIEVFINSGKLREVDLERQLEERFEMLEAIVVDTDQMSKDNAANLIYLTTAKYIKKMIIANDINSIGISWGNTIKGVIDHFDYNNFPKLTISATIGGMGETFTQIHSNHLVYEFSRKTNAKTNYLYIPAIIDNQLIREEMLKNEIVISSLNFTKKVELALMGIASPYTNSTMKEHGYITDEDIKIFKKLGVVGDINSRFFNESGDVVDCEINNKVVGLYLDDIKNIRNTVTCLSQIEKAYPLKILIENKIINSAIVTKEIADYLLKE